MSAAAVSSPTPASPAPATPTASAPSIPSSPSMAGMPIGPANFTGNWIMDVDASDTLEALVAYHAPAVRSSSTSISIRTTASANGEVQQSTSSSTAAALPPVHEDSSENNSRRNSVTDGEAASAASAAASAASASSLTTPGAIPALIIQHSTRRLTTYCHELVPILSATGELLRYDPVRTASGKLTVAEEYKLDGAYHMVNSARGKVSARAYHAPHGQSLVVDTRCASKYDLERTERFLEDDGKRLVIETRILSCAPEVQADADAPVTSGVSKKFESGSVAPVVVVPTPVPAAPTPQAAPAQVVVKEILFRRRVFKRILDATPATPASGEGSAGGLLDFDAAAGAGAGGKPRARAGSGALAVESAEATKATLLRMQLSPAALAILPDGLTRGKTATATTAVATAASTSSSSSSSSSAWVGLSNFFYPRHFLLKRYQLTDLLFDNSASSAISLASLPASLTTAIAHEQAAYSSARRWMRLVDLVLLAILAVYILLQLGVFSREELVHQLEHMQESLEAGVHAGAAAVQQQVHLVQAQVQAQVAARALDLEQTQQALAVQISNVATTITTAPPMDSMSEL